MNTLVVILGPTGVGKTELSINLAKFFRCDIISSDSRQMYRGMDIGTAKPTHEELTAVRHHFIDNLGLDDYYSAARYEEDVIGLLTSDGGLFSQNPVQLMVGGSMMYIDAVCNGIDDIPTVDDETRTMMKQRLADCGLERLCDELRMLDPEYYAIVDKHNTQRIVHALEICYMTGKTYTSFRTNGRKERPFRIVKIGLMREREELFSRINQRTEQMMADGFLSEVHRLTEPYIYKGVPFPNSLNTVGYKEMINVLLGDWELPFAVARMQKNTRVYAKKQMTWFQKDTDIHWLPAATASEQDIVQML